MGFIPYSPVDGGLLAGALDKQKTGRRTGDWITNRPESEREKIRKYEDFCKQAGYEPAQLALAWLYNNPDVTAPIIGPRTMEHLESAVKATDIILDKEILAKLDEIFPGHGGEAPKAYAW
jgi:aryl-alcohol dehydrogenase-like predicted oxidoreductase